MSTTTEQATSHLSPTTRGAEPTGRPVAPMDSVGALVSRRAAGFGTEPRSF